MRRLRDRLVTLDAELARADATGDATKAATAASERDDLLVEALLVAARTAPAIGRAAGVLLIRAGAYFAWYGR